MKSIQYIQLLSVVFFTTIFQGALQAQEYKIIVGTYTQNTESKGVYVLNIQPEKKKYAISDIAGGIQNPGYLVISKDKKNVYVASEFSDKSKIIAYQLDRKTGKLNFLNSVSTDGIDPCFIDASKKNLFTADYSSGDIQMFNILKNKKVSNVIQTISFTGSSINNERQTKPHAHQSILSKDAKYLFTNDLGTDYLRIFKVHPDKLIALDSLKIKAGSGPRHLTYNQDGSILYLLNELSADISVISFRNEKMNLLQTISIIAKNNGLAHAADIHMSPDGKFLYATNRTNYNEIILFKILPDQTLERIANYSVKGIFPRNFMITQDGNFIFVANQKTNQIVVFQRDKKLGLLKDINFTIDIPSPVCIKEF